MHPRNCKIPLIRTGTCESCVGMESGGRATVEGVQLWAGLALLLGVCAPRTLELSGHTSAAGSDATRPRGCVPSAPGSTVNELEMPEPPRSEQAPKGAGKASHM